MCSLAHEGAKTKTLTPKPRAADLKVKRITPRHLQLAIRGDEELDLLIKVRGGGAVCAALWLNSANRRPFRVVVSFRTSTSR